MALESNGNNVVWLSTTRADQIQQVRVMYIQMKLHCKVRGVKKIENKKYMHFSQWGTKIIRLKFYLQLVKKCILLTTGFKIYQIEKPLQ